MQIEPFEVVIQNSIDNSLTKTNAKKGEKYPGA